MKHDLNIICLLALAISSFHIVFCDRWQERDMWGKEMEWNIGIHKQQVVYPQYNHMRSAGQALFHIDLFTHSLVYFIINLIQS